MVKAASKYVWQPDEETFARANVVRLMRKHGVDDYWELVAGRRRTPSGSGRRDRGHGPRVLASPGTTSSTSRAGRNGRPGSSAASSTSPGTASTAGRSGARPRSRRSGCGEDGSRRELTFAELSAEVTRLAEALVRLGVGEGDRVAIFLPMSPEVAIASHACAHIGAIQVPIFSGFAAPAVAQRLQASEAKVAITARELDAARHARCRCSRSSRRRGARPRASSTSSSRRGTSSSPTRRASSRPLELDSETPYLLTYTSGTTGRAEGRRPRPGRLPRLDRARGLLPGRRRAGDRIHFATDMGWIMGPWTVVGGGAMGSTLVFAEGAPDWPQDRLWKTGRGGTGHRARALADARRAPLIPHGDPVARTCPRCARSSPPASRGTPAVPLALREVGGGRCPIINCSGGTEVGACFLSPTVAIPIKACSLGGPALGMAMDVVDADGSSLRPARSASSSAASRSRA